MIRRAALAATLLLTLAACNPTTYDSSADTTLPPSTSSTLPAGTLQELLPRMQHEVAGLSALVITGKGDGESATRIEQYWAALTPEVTTRWPDLVEDFNFVVRLCRDAADRRRPANADRAAKNLDALATAVLG
ncbi:MAG: hypothetical protein F2681_06490 [Actinobacteria bacterium]|uniref:Unannotated protein n=1 Tax=freshwater metagenome TaxID=449393 RepID=A0A6J6RBS7_9ZZZZ|nr:hypothetical protein [Actinomycetota bacterium]MSW77297.1 hypothetical protein [Actinomycetota bacterium]MSX56153.1 hypothetical protein [Actinomycetota bacterium]MSX93879.1 hypothetical protein [Actinomycetota bacterium]MSZ82772.1 hypothetical protein [Actinomycetota bacterium]